MKEGLIKYVRNVKKSGIESEKIRRCGAGNEASRQSENVNRSLDNGQRRCIHLLICLLGEEAPAPLMNGRGKPDDLRIIFGVHSSFRNRSPLDFAASQLPPLLARIQIRGTLEHPLDHPLRYANNFTHACTTLARNEIFPSSSELGENFVPNFQRTGRNSVVR